MANPRIEDTIRDTIHQYVRNLDGEAEPNNLYHLIINEVEGVVIHTILEYHNHNQSKTAKWLGITRNTLKHKMINHGLCEK